MPNIQVNTAAPTSMINNNDDKNMSSTSLGGSSPVINLGLQKKSFGPPNEIKPHIDKTDYSKHTKKETKEEEKPKEPEINEEQKPKTQGEYEQTLQNLNNSLEKYQALKDSLKQIPNNSMGKIILAKTLEKQLNSKEVQKMESQMKNLNTEQFKDYINNYLNDKLIETRNNINDIMNNDNYDDRTPEQKREDTGFQRQYQDMLKAGYNPASFTGGGGGGVGGSSARNEEEERKKRKKEREERKAAEQAAKQRQIMQMLGMVMGVGGLIGSGYMRNKGMVQSADIRAKGMQDVQKLRSQDNQLNNIYRQQMNDKNLDYRYNTIKYRSYDKDRKAYKEYYNYK